MNYLKLFGIAILLALSGCVSNIHTETRPIENPGSFAGGQTYVWTDANLSMMAPKEMPSSTFSDAIREQVDNSLANLGYVKVSSLDQADFTVDAVLTLSREESQRIETNILYDRDDYLQYGLRWRFVPNESIVKPSAAFPNIEISVYEKGTLHIGAFDKSGQIAWHGEAHKIIEKHHAPDEHEAVLREATRKIMKRFPKR